MVERGLPSAEVKVERELERRAVEPDDVKRLNTDGWDVIVWLVCKQTDTRLDPPSKRMIIARNQAPTKKACEGHSKDLAIKIDQLMRGSKTNNRCGDRKF